MCVCVSRDSPLHTLLPLCPQTTSKVLAVLLSDINDIIIIIIIMYRVYQV